MSEEDRWLNNSQFAAAEGCDEKQVRRGLASGKLVARADGKLDVAQVRSGWRRPRVDSREFRTPAASAPAQRVATPPPARSTRMRRSEAVQRLQALDWGQAWDWSDDAQHTRLQGAAAVVGLEAVQSPLDDDGHWGGYQLRNLAVQVVHGGLCFEAVAAGYGFELDTFQALVECREHLHHPDDTADDLAEIIEVRLDLLPLLAYPFGPTHQRPTATEGTAP